MSAPKLSFAFGKPKPKENTNSAPSLRKPVAFGSLDDDDTPDAAPTAPNPRSSTRHPARNMPASTSASSLSRAAKNKMEKELSVDSTVYEYDEVYDQMKEAQARVKAAKAAEDVERKVGALHHTYITPCNLASHSKPKYIGALLASAETRRLDHIRAEEFMIQREREHEGDMYADKERFVTQAYKDQREKVRQAEKEEKEREGKLLSHFIVIQVQTIHTA